MTRSRLRALAAIAALAAVALVAVPVLGVDPSRSPSTGTVASAAPSTPPGPSVAPSASAAAPAASGKPDKAAKPSHEDAPEKPVTLTGVVGAARGDDREFTLTVGSTVYALDAGPKWWWGDANPLASVVGKRVTISGEQGDAAADVDVLAIDGTAIRAAGKPPWAGGWKVVGPRHPGWAQWKVDKLAGKGHGHGPKGEPQAQPSPSP